MKALCIHNQNSFLNWKWLKVIYANFGLEAKITYRDWEKEREIYEPRSHSEMRNEICVSSHTTRKLKTQKLAISFFQR